MTMLTFYEKILKLGDLVVDSDGMVSHRPPGTEKNTPFLVQQKRLILPTDAHLSNPDWSNRIGFNPLVETQVGSESHVHERFRRAIVSALNLRVSYAFIKMANICRKDNKEEQNKLGPEYFGLLTAIADADDKFYNNLVALIDKHISFVHLVTQRGLKNNENHWRVGTEVHFPLLDTVLKSSDRKLHGIQFRIADMETLKNIYEFIFPDSDKPGTYTKGSNSDYAPTLFSSLSATLNLYKQINKLYTTYGDLMQSPEFVVDLSDIEDIISNPKEIIASASKIGLLEGNGAKVKKQNGQPAKIELTPNTVNTQPAPSPTIPVQSVTKETIPVQQPAKLGVEMQVQKLGSPANVTQNTQNLPSGRGFYEPRSIPVEHRSAPVQNQPVMFTPQGPVAIKQVSLQEANAMVAQQQQQQQQQMLQMQQTQMKVNQARSLGYQVVQMQNGTMGVALSDGKGGVVYQDVNEWQPPTTPAGMPVATGAVGPVMPNVPVQTQPNNPAGTVSVDQWLRNNPVMANAYNQNAILMQQQQMMHNYQTQAYLANQQNQQYIPTHMRAAQAFGTNMIAPVGGI